MSYAQLERYSRGRGRCHCAGARVIGLAARTTNQDHVGSASAINNAVGRMAGVLAIAIFGVVNGQSLWFSTEPQSGSSFAVAWHSAEASRGRDQTRGRTGSPWP